MPDFSNIEDTLFVPMLGRIYASEHFPSILMDKKALALKSKLPENLKGKDTQTQYTLMASAVRSTNMDRYIRDFMHRNTNGIIVQLGCGLETTFYRDDNGRTQWYEVDLPEVIKYRMDVLGGCPRDTHIVANAFEEDWIKAVRAEHPDAPMLVTASGLFYYFEEDIVLHLFKLLKSYGPVEIVFDAVNASGMKRMSKYMKQVGHEDAPMFFYVDDAKKLAQSIGGTALKEEPYYAHTSKKGLSLVTSTSMRVSDKFMMVKMVHLRLN